MASERALCLLTLLALPALAGGPLVGAGVGNADTLASEASKLFNQKQYGKAAELFLTATRVNPANLTNYLQLARAHMLARQLQRACYSYRVFLKASPETPERKKASAESDQCERQLRSARGEPIDLTPKYVETRAAFFAALDRHETLGPAGAFQAFQTLVQDGFLGPELSDMGAKLGAAAAAEADAIHQQVLRLEPISPELLRSARPLYQVASDVGASPPDAKARMAFLDGLAALAERDFVKAEALFAEAAGGDPANKEYTFYRALTLFQAGERFGALKVMESELKDDPRTAVLRAVVAVGHSPENGAAELEKLLFGSRFPKDQ